MGLYILSRKKTAGETELMRGPPQKETKNREDPSRVIQVVNEKGNGGFPTRGRGKSATKLLRKK